MNEYLSLACFVQEWACYLEQHGHQVKQLSEHPAILISRNGKGDGYRWLLWCVDANDMLLMEDQIRTIRAQVRLAKKGRQQCFVVIKFGDLGSRVVTTPAAQALRVKFISSNKGAIPWDP